MFYNEGFTSLDDTANYMAWSHRANTSDSEDYLYLDGLTIETRGGGGGGGGCLGTITVSAFAVIALVILRAKVQKHKEL